MPEESLNKKTKLKPLRRGLALYQTGRSPYWYARFYDLRSQRYVVRPTKESGTLDAAEVAEEIYAKLKANQNTDHAARKDRSFEHYTQVLKKISEVKAHCDRNKRAFTDERKLLFREKDGINAYFGKYDVGRVISGMVRDYLVFLDNRRDKPLAASTKQKQCMMIRKVLMLALEDGVIDIIPPMPKPRTKDAPRVTFTGAEYKKLITTAKAIASDGQTRVRGALVTHEHVDKPHALASSEPKYPH